MVVVHVALYGEVLSVFESGCLLGHVAEYLDRKLRSGAEDKDEKRLNCCLTMRAKS